MAADQGSVWPQMRKVQPLRGPFMEHCQQGSFPNYAVSHYFLAFIYAYSPYSFLCPFEPFCLCLFIF